MLNKILLGIILIYGFQSQVNLDQTGIVQNHNLAKKIDDKIECTPKLDLNKIYGKIKIVEHFPDYKVKLVEHFPDLKVKIVEHFPIDVGKWKIVEHFPDYKIKFVEHFPDFTIKYVEHFPGVK